MKLIIAIGLSAWISSLAVIASAEDLGHSSPPSSAAGAETEPVRGEKDGASEEATVTPPATVSEARARAMLLHETIAGALQVVHRDFFDDENVHAIPSASLEDVFAELLKSYDVTVRWLIVDTDVVNVDHKPRDEFEQSAAKSLAQGNPRFEAAGEAMYRYAGSIRLASQCLKCHVKDRTSTEERTAGLLISMPLLRPAAPSRPRVSSNPAANAFAPQADGGPPSAN